MSRFFLFFSLIFLLHSNISLAQENSGNIYFIENVTANASAKNPTEARNLALNAAHKDAFLILLARLNLDLNLSESLNSTDIANMVQSEQIYNEKIAGNNYSAIFNVTFDKKFVDHSLGQKNIKKSSTTKITPYLLVPAKEEKGKIILWQKDNDWKRAIEIALARQVQHKFFVPDSTLENITAINDDNVKDLSYSDIEPLVNKYNISTSYILIFSFDDIENKAVIEVNQINKLQKNQSRLRFVNVNHLSYHDLLNKVAEKVVEHLSQLQQEEKKTSNLVKIEIDNQNLENLMAIKNKIENSNLIDQINIESVARDRAIISVNYINPNFNLEESFAKIGLLLVKKSDKLYHLQF